MISDKKRGQQEIVGFVLIVVLVVIGLMVFLIISTRDSGNDVESGDVSNMLSAIMKQTTECALVYEPDYDNFEDLFVSCYKGKRCSNLGEDACDYLNRSLEAVLEGMFAIEADIEAYQLDFIVKDEEGQVGLLRIFDGNCTGEMTSTQKSIVTNTDDKLFVQMKICKISSS